MRVEAHYLWQIILAQWHVAQTAHIRHRETRTGCHLELLQLISEQTPAVALAITIWFFSNRDTLRFLQERREMIEALRLERKEWNDELRLITDRYDMRQREATESKMLIQAEMHTLKGQITTLILKVEAWMARDDRRGGQSGGNSGGND